ncbi:hypothetical protein V2154_15585 [Ewingella sp. CoE-038-23]|uniref:gp53-like domain-containing protein n=1 Tax=Ewingella docleensis TaxID=3118588 RepID=UPI0033659E61
MPTNDFKPFATSPGANVLSQADYNALTAVLTGWQSGVAKSTEVNKAMRQATFIASAIAQFVADSSGRDVLDDGSVANFITKLKLANSSQYLGNGNNLSEIAASGGAAQLQARESIGLTGMGIGVAPLQALPSLDWQQFDFVAGANYASLFSSWVNQPAGVTYPSGSFISITVDYLLNGGDFGVTVLPNTSSNPNYMVYKIRGSGGKGARTFNVRQVFTSADTIPLSSGGLGATTPAGGRAELGLGTAALANVGNGSGQLPDMSYFTAGAGWIKYPNGKIIQYGYLQTSTSSSVVASFPIPFPSQCYGITSSGTDASAANISGCQIIDRTSFFASAWLATAGSVNRTATNVSWIAVGI